MSLHIEKYKTKTTTKAKSVNSTYETEYGSSIDKVWRIVTDNENYGWRSDLSAIEILPESDSFIEKSKGGIDTLFTVTMRIPHNRYEMDFENENIKGHFVGEFTSHNGRTRAVFTENVTSKKKCMFFMGTYLKKMQRKYASDLRKALGE